MSISTLTLIESTKTKLNFVFQDISPQNRAQLIDDAFNLVR